MKRKQEHNPILNPSLEKFGRKFKIIKYEVDARTFYHLSFTYMKRSKKFWLFGPEVRTEKWQYSDTRHEYGRSNNEWDTIESILKYIDSSFTPVKRSQTVLSADDIEKEIAEFDAKQLYK